jgi:hypothetical protein
VIASAAALGIAGVNTRPLMRASDPLIGIAGNWGSTLRPHVARLVGADAAISGARLGDQAALHAWTRACYFFRICCDRPGVGPNHVDVPAGVSWSGDGCSPTIPPSPAGQRGETSE